MLENENFRQQKALNEKGVVTRYLLEQTKFQLHRLEAITNENRQLKQRNDYLLK